MPGVVPIESLIIVRIQAGVQVEFVVVLLEFLAESPNI